LTHAFKFLLLKMEKIQRYMHSSMCQSIHGMKGVYGAGT
jgi:hypothetical protein